MLNVDVEVRCTIAELRICHWIRGPTSPLTPYTTTKHGEKECLPKVTLDPFRANDTYLPGIPGPSSLTAETRHSVQTSQHCPLSYTPAANIMSTHTHHTANCSTHVTSQAVSTIADSKQKGVHRRKKTRLEQRLRVLNDPTNTTVILPSTIPPKAGMKAKISSAGKKMVQTFLRHSSSPDAL